MKLKLKILVFLFGLAISMSAQVSFKAYTSNDGLINNTVFSIGQDGEGFMWFGTATGLSRFDGKTFTSFLWDKNDPQSIPGREIRQLSTDAQGNLWVLTNGVIARFDKLKQNFVVYSPAHANNQNIKGSANSIYFDGQNFFLCTSNGLYIYNYQNESFEQQFSDIEPLSNTIIYDILKTDDNNLWLVKPDEIIVVRDSLASNFSVLKAKENAFSLNGFNDIIELNDGNVYVSCRGKGITIINEQTLHVSPFPKELSSNVIRSMATDGKGRLWIATELGINIYNPYTKRISVSKQDFNNEHSLNDNAIYPLFKDKHNNMWAGTYFGGVNVNLAKGNRFKHYKAGEEPHYLSGKAVSQIIEDKGGNLWIGTEDGGVNYFNTKNKTFKHYTPQASNSLSYVNVHSLYSDRDENLWIGTYLGGLNVFDGKTFKYYRAGQGNGLRNDHVYALNVDFNNNVLIGSSGGLHQYNKATNNFTVFSGAVGHSHIYDIYKSTDSTLWVATTGRGIFFKDIASDRFHNIDKLIENPSLPLPTQVIFIAESSDGLVWFGTIDEGLYFFDRKTKNLKRYTTADGLPDNTIYSIIEDQSQNLWLTTNCGLVRFYRSEMYFRVFTTRDGLPNNQFNYKAGFRHSDGTIYLGSVDGLIAFNPEGIQFNDRPPEVKIVEFSIFNETILPEDKNSLISDAIFNTKTIELKHNQNVIGFTFTAIDYTAPETNRFAYKMEGLEESWNEIGNYNKASYSHLPPGNYVFRVKACNNDGIWNEEGTSIGITVHPPFWLSIWGYLIYFLIFGLILWLYRRYSLMRLAEKSALEREKMEKEKLKEINQLKLKFYTNVSHEFRTPLSLIVDPLEKMIENDIRNPKIKNTANLVLRNAKRLQTLVNQLLDFRKTESGQFQLNVAHLSIHNFAENIFERFKPLAESKQIHFSFHYEAKIEKCWFDPKIIDIVLYNLLSNAFKFTPEKGKIVLRITETQTSKIEIAVEDNGLGISETDKNRVFDNFYQIENKNEQGGSGIGLALCKSLVNLHRGTIEVKGELGIGSTFVVEIPVSEQAFSMEEKAKHPYKDELSPTPQATEQEAEEKQLHTDANKILIVEDNQELREYIESSLQGIFKIQTAANGILGWEQVKQYKPDIVISDVMMPKMDGFELCKKIKSDIQTSHIPVILLTAKSGQQNQSEGLKLGADIYLEKPFNRKVLISQLNNLITLKARFIKRFESELGIDIAEVTHSTKDEEFIKKAIQVIFKHLDNPGFNVTGLLEEMAISRSLLHLKLKEITGKSASEFIQFIKLKEAARLLQNNSITISEVADQTGYNDPSYFSKCFKKQYQLSPKAYRTKYSSE